MQGAYKFLSLDTWKVIVRRSWTELPIPNDVLRVINSKTEDIDVGVDVDDDVGGNAAGDLVNEDDHSTATAKQKAKYAAEAVVTHNPESSEDDDSDEGHSSSSSSNNGKPIAGVRKRINPTREELDAISTDEDDDDDDDDEDESTDSRDSIEDEDGNDNEDEHIFRSSSILTDAWGTQLALPSATSSLR